MIAVYPRAGHCNPPQNLNIGDGMENSKSKNRLKTLTIDFEQTPQVQAITIDRIKLDKLFGLYSYDIPNPFERLGRTPILYGENGLGKTNILKILFHLLSPAEDRGHRTALRKIKFQKVQVFLSNNIIVSAFKQGENFEGLMRLEVTQKKAKSLELLGAWELYPEDDHGRDVPQRWLGHVDSETLQMISENTSARARHKAMQAVLFKYLEKESNPLESEEAFLRALRKNVPPIYFLTADRVLSSDQVGRDVATLPDMEARPMRPEVMLTKGRERALNEAISMASRKLSRLGVIATRQGSHSMHSIYQDLLRRLASRAQSNYESAPQSIFNLTANLIDLSEKYDKYAKYGLAPQLNGLELVKLLENVRPSEQSVAAEVLKPYVESLSEQANSFEKAYAVIDPLVSTVNQFLYDKSLEFSLGEGMVVRNKLGDVLHPHDLSSGEQQLLLLFCHITMANESGGIFIIDEPEISLNVKWQRRLVDSLLSLDLTNNLQFILASHSIEILTRHRDSVVPLQESSQ